MDPTATCCPNRACPARGQTGQGNIGIHARQDKRFICRQCRKTCTTTKGTVFSRLHTSAALLVEQPRDLGQVQADEIRVKRQGDIVWMALAMMVGTRWWLAGEVSTQRDMPLMRRLIERVRRCAAHRPLWCWTEGVCSSVRAMRETLREAGSTGRQGRPRLRPWRHLCMAQVVKRSTQRRMVDVERRIVDGTPARVETLRRRSQGDGVINTASIERLNATCRERLAALTRRGRALARRPLTLHHGISLVGTV